MTTAHTPCYGWVLSSTKLECPVQVIEVHVVTMINRQMVVVANLQRLTLTAD